MFEDERNCRAAKTGCYMNNFVILLEDVVLWKCRAKKQSNYYYRPAKLRSAFWYEMFIEKHTHHKTVCR